MKKVKISILFVLVLMLAACGTTKVAWDKLSSEDKAKIVLEGIQSDLNSKFDLGKAYVASHPEYKELWKAKIVPSFDLANKTMKDAMDIAKGGGTLSVILNKVNPVVQNCLDFLTQIGALKK